MEREEVRRLAMLSGFGNVLGGVDGLDELERFASLVAAAERERSAKVCDDLAELNRVSATDSMWQWGECAAAIRALD